MRGLRAHVGYPQARILDNLALQREVPLLRVGRHPLAVHDNGFERAVERAVRSEAGERELIAFFPPQVRVLQLPIEEEHAELNGETLLALFKAQSCGAS